jgi:hypothetical protein
MRFQKLFGKSLEGCACVFSAHQSPAPEAHSAAMRLRSRGLLNAKSATLAFFPLTKQLLKVQSEAHRLFPDLQ